MAMMRRQRKKDDEDVLAEKIQGSEGAKYSGTSSRGKRGKRVSKIVFKAKGGY